MTVAAVILSATAEGAVADTLGQPRVRRLVDIAWSGGALPVVVVAPDPDGAVARSLIGSEATYGSPAPAEAGPAGQMLHGAELALAEVVDTSAVLVWPARMTWVGPETITSLIEAHGTDPSTVNVATAAQCRGLAVRSPSRHRRIMARCQRFTARPASSSRCARSTPTMVSAIGSACAPAGLN